MRWRHFITMWVHPRMAAWTLFTALAVALVRLPFAAMQVIPFTVEFHPGFVLTPAAGIFCGPAGVLGVLAGSLLGDLITGLWGPMTAYRAVGQVVAALSAHALWWAGCGASGEPAAGQVFRAAARFAAASLPGAFAAAAWYGVGADAAHWYPFPGVATPVLIGNLFFLLLFAPAVVDTYARHGYPAFGNWATVMGVEMDLGPSRLGRVLTWSGGIGAYLLGLAAGGWVGGSAPGAPAVLGTWSGWPVYLAAALGFVVHLAGIALVLRPEPKPSRAEANPSRPDLRFLRPLD